MIIEGNIAVKAALNSDYREVKKVLINENKRSKDISYIISLAKSKNIIVERCSLATINSLATGKTNGGVIAEVTSRKLQTIDELLVKENPFLVLIEGVEDNYNLGYIMRTLFALGCDGILIPNRDFSLDDPTIIKSSAGSSEQIPLYLSNDLESDLNLLKDKGFKIKSCYRGKEPINLFDSKLTNEPLLICLGGPLRGLSKVILDNSEEFIYIPYANDFRNALNVSSATAVIATEVYRQRNHI